MLYVANAFIPAFYLLFHNYFNLKFEYIKFISFFMCCPIDSKLTYLSLIIYLFSYSCLIHLN